MAKVPAKTAPKKVAAKKVPAKKVAAKKEVAAKATTPKIAPAKVNDIEVAAKLALAKLQELNLDNHLQSDLKWCLGSYTHDKNPAGLYTMMAKAIALLGAEKNKKEAGVTAKFIADLAKALPKK